jgi:hypothetical protein
MAAWIGLSHPNAFEGEGCVEKALTCVAENLGTIRIQKEIINDLQVQRVPSVPRKLLIVRCRLN